MKRLLSLGWFLLPLRPGEKRPMTRHGVKDATRDPNQIHQWFSQIPRPNLGVAGGNGLVIIDADKAEGLQTAKALSLPLTVSTSTPRGRHWYFTTDKPIRCSKNRLGPGIDVRGIGGYVVAPPSIVNGRRYRWRRSPFVVEVAPLPEGIESILAPACTVSPAAIAHALSTGETVQAGPDQSRSGLDARRTIHLVQQGFTKPQVLSQFELFSEKYQEKLALYGSSVANNYFDKVHQWAQRFVGQGRVRVQVVGASLEVLGAVLGRAPLARMVLEVGVLGRSDEVHGVTVALGSEMAKAVAPDLDQGKLLRPGGYLLVKRLVGRRLEGVIRGGRVLRLSRC